MARTRLGSDKRAGISMLPGGRRELLNTLAKFLEYVASRRPGREELTSWVMSTFEQVGRGANVAYYINNILRGLDFVDVDGADRLVLTERGRQFLGGQREAVLLLALEERILGVEELLQFLSGGPADVDTINEHLNEILPVTWTKSIQTRIRLWWLAAGGAVEQEGRLWCRTR